MREIRWILILIACAFALAWISNGDASDEARCVPHYHECDVP